MSRTADADKEATARTQHCEEQCEVQRGEPDGRRKRSEAKLEPYNMNTCPLCASPLTTVHIGGRDRIGCTKCEFVYWNNPLPVTATLIPHDDGLVLVKRKFEPFVGWWCLPGGFMESAEHPEESAIREVYEETGLTVEIERLLGAYSPGRGINVIILFYLAKRNNGILQAGDDAEEVQTFKVKDLPEQIAFDLHRKMISDFFESNGK